MGSAEMIQKVAAIIADKKQEGRKPLVVVSAMSGVTDQLLRAAKLAIGKAPVEERQSIIDALHEKHMTAAETLIKDEARLLRFESFLEEKLSHFREFLFAIAIIQEMTPPSHDEIVSLGERLSAALLAMHMEDEEQEASFVDLAHIIERHTFDDIGGEFFDAVEVALINRVQGLVSAGVIPVMTGFFGNVPNGIIGAVGRGYSDFTIALAGAAFGVKEIQVWTDVDGLLSADPRIVQGTCVLPEVSFEEAGELAEFGAKVLHPQTIWPAVKKNIPVRIKNTMNPAAEGTLITRTGRDGEYICKSVANKKGITVITLTSPRMLLAVGFLADVFGLFKKYGIAVDLVSTGEISVTVTFVGGADDLPQGLLDELRVFSRVDVLEGQAIVCAIGSELTKKKGVLAKIFTIVAEEGVTARAVSASAHKINISFVVAEEDADKTLFALHKQIFEGMHCR